MVWATPLPTRAALLVFCWLNMCKEADEALKKQIILLSERSSDSKISVEELCSLTGSMIKVYFALFGVG